MISSWIIIGLIISGISVSSLGAYFSIVGIGALFSGAVLAVWAMAASLELAKFVLAAYLHQKWQELNVVYKSYLVSAVVILSLITSMGIFGFLSDAYQSASTTLEAENIKLQSLHKQVESSKAEIERLNRSIEEIPATRISRRIKARAEAEPVVAELTKKIDQINAQITQADLVVLEVKKKVGPLIYISKAFNMDIDDVVKYLIFIFVLVFDPLAICLVIAISESLGTRRLQQAQRPQQQQATEASKVESEPASQESVPEDEIIQMRFADEEEDKKKADDSDKNAV